MHETTAQYTESIRACEAHGYGHNKTTYHPALNIPELIKLLEPLSAPENNDASDDEITEFKGKKRGRTSRSREPSSKRLKRSDSHADNDNEEEEAAYPNFPLQYKGQPLEDTIHVFRHVFDIQYTTVETGNDSAQPANERSLEKALNALAPEPPSEPLKIELGQFHVSMHQQRLLLATDDHRWLLQLPVYGEDVDLDDYDFVSVSAQNVLTAAYVLKTENRTYIRASLTLVLLPEGAYDPSSQELPLRLQVRLDVSLGPMIFQLMTGTKSRVREMQDVQRRFLHFLYPTSDSSVQHVNIPFFLSNLGCAPPLKTRMATESMQPLELRPTLLPFQRRSVGWLLGREGMSVSESGQLEPSSPSSEFSFWEQVEEGAHTWYLHRLTGELSRAVEPETQVLGGILAEEPGLGKTIETISLILNNPASASRNPSVTPWDPEAKLDVKAIKTTLIVTPPALASQWVDEIAAHAPTLKVLVYDGWAKVPVPITQTQIEEERERRLKDAKQAARKEKAKALAPPSRTRKGKAKAKDTDSNKENSQMPIDGTDPDEIVDWYTYVNKFDVVITTYATLRNDFNVARAAPTRPRREDVVYTNVERPRSPLVMCEWYRVVMDEVQMVGGGKTEDMVSLIPRLSSFAVSGTPARTQVSDLIHVLKFLRVDSVVGRPGLWNRLLYPGYASQFAALFKYYSLRTMKADVKHELTIPQQTRYLVSIEMGRVERHVYDQALEKVLLELGLDARGVAGSEGWEVDGVLLRSSVRRLRGICTHPQVGQLQRQANDNLFKPGALKSMEEVLQTMRDQNWRNLMDDWKAKVQGLVQICQLHQADDSNHHRYQHALDTLVTAERECSKLIKEIETAVMEHRQVGELLKKEAAALREQRQQGMDGAKGKGRAASPYSASEDEDVDEEENSEDKDIPKTPAGVEYRHKLSGLRARLRESQIVLHRIKFLQGDVYHVLGASHGPQEDAAYQAAEMIRRNLLKTTEDEAAKGMAQLNVDTAKGEVDSETLLIPLPYLERGGVRSADTIIELHEIIEDVLNVQAGLLWEWRTHLHKILTQPLSNENRDTADGEEYQRTLETQGQAETYLQAYQALLADYREALSNERTALAAHDAREKKLRHTKAAMKAAQTTYEDELLIEHDIELQPEDEVLRKTLADERKVLLKELDGRAVKTFLVTLTGIAGRVQRDQDPEKILLKEAISRLRKLINDQIKALAILEADLALFRKAFNQRVLYFRQLQEISDSVAELVLEKPLDETMEDCKTEQTELDAKINASKARQRYLDHIAQDAMDEDDDEGCILCKCEFIRGFITQCAHVFCEGCMQAWLKKKDGKACPVCRVPIDVDNLQRFTVTGPEAPPPAKLVHGEPVPKSTRQIAYNMIDPILFKEIEKIESFGDFGNKIQTLVRHLLYIQMNDPGAKSIVFSAWADSLHIMERALKENGIPCLRIDQGSRGKTAAKKFRSDPDILVLLLHGERENAGLNITCASRVFLLESVVHHGFEIQAIARIDRMGQTRSTEVFCYYAEDTVERNILDLAARRGLSLYTKENSAGTLNVSSFASEADKAEVEAPTKKKDQKGDFITKIDDMLAVLFPHMYEDLEYVLPSDGDAVMEDSQNAAVAGASRVPQQINAQAGPSRIHY